MLFVPPKKSCLSKKDVSLLIKDKMWLQIQAIVNLQQLAFIEALRLSG